MTIDDVSARRAISAISSQPVNAPPTRRSRNGSRASTVSCPRARGFCTAKSSLVSLHRGPRPKRIHARQKRSRRLSKRSGGSEFSDRLDRLTTGLPLFHNRRLRGLTRLLDVSLLSTAITKLEWCARDCFAGRCEGACAAVTLASGESALLPFRREPTVLITSGEHYGAVLNRTSITSATWTRCARTI